ncbi:hypothetical protein [Escherichia coli]|nr:hypothetical protein [Escherichia coli]
MEHASKMPSSYLYDQ